MKRKKLTASITALAMALTMVPVLSYADTDSEAAGNEESELIVVYKADAECTEILQEEDFGGSVERTSDTVEELAEDCTEQIAEDAEARIEEGEFLADSIGQDGAALQVTLEDGADADKVIDSLSKRDDIAYVQPNYKYHLFEESEDVAAEKNNDGESDGIDDAKEAVIHDDDLDTVKEESQETENDKSLATDGTEENIDGAGEELNDPSDMDDSEAGTASDTNAYNKKEAAAEDETTDVKADEKSDADTKLSLMSTSTNDAYAGEQYYLDAWSKAKGTFGADVLEAWDEVKANKTVTVAVLDTGVKVNHPDLKANLDIANSYSVTGSINDDHGHGTHVTGIIAAVANNGKGIAGASYNAKVIPIKIMDGGGNITTANLLAGLEHIKKLVGSGKVKNLHVINLSLGTYDATGDAAIQSAIKELRNDYDIVTVCAGGNGDEKVTPYTDRVFPGDLDESFCVTALDESGNNLVYSDYNKYKDISAPGASMVSTFLGNDYAYGSGTSMAAPLVSGIMALLWAENPNLSVANAVKAVESTANPVNTEKNYTVRKGKTGSKGAIDAAKAVAYVEKNYGSVKKNIRKFKNQITLSATSYEYSGSARKPAVRISGLKSGTDFKVTYKNNVKIGTASVVITGAGSYNGTITKTFKITKRNISKLSGKTKLSSTSYVYNGKARKPAVRISGLKSGTDFKVAYKSNVKVGTATVTITGINTYGGAIKKTFNIRPKATKVKSLKKKRKAIVVKWQKKKTQVTGYQIQYSLKKSMKGAKIKTVPGSSKVQKKVKKLKAKKRYYVRVRTYKKTGGKTYYSAWSSRKSVKTR